MDRDRRINELQTQDDLKRMLNGQQRKILQQMEMSGWSIMFIRNQLFHPMITVLGNREDGTVVVLEENGTITKEHDLQLRPDNH